MRKSGLTKEQIPKKKKIVYSCKDEGGLNLVYVESSKSIKNPCVRTEFFVTNEKKKLTRLGYGLSTISKYFKEALIEGYGEEEGFNLFVEMWLDNDYLWQNIGNQMHKILHSVLTPYFDSMGMVYYSEVSVFPPKIIDGLLLNDTIFYKDFKDNKFIALLLENTYLARTLGLTSQKLEKIKALNIDYTLNATKKNLMDKIIKYQSPETFLFIVLLDQYYRCKTKSLPIDDNILFRDNIIIIGLDLFLDLIGLPNNLRNYFESVYEMVDEGNLKELMNEPILDSNERHNTQVFEINLKELGLIRKNISEFFIPYSQKKNFPTQDSQNNLDFYI
ncbi:MAG: hypothetical protein ACFFAS_12520 [Promethearchaeota archaeon]